MEDGRQKEALKHMTMILSLLLFAAAYFLIEGGLQFVGILSAVIGVLLIFTSGGKKSHSGNVSIHEPMGPNGPVVVEQKLPDIPAKMYVKVKPDWTDRVAFEYAMEHTGWVVDRIFRWLFHLMGSKK
jgi:hypothetical protein